MLYLTELFSGHCGVTEGDFLKQDGGNTFFENGTINNTTGKITGIQAVQLSKGEMSRHGTLLSVTFTAIANGESQLTVDNFQAGSGRGEKIPATPSEMTLSVGGSVAATPAWGCQRRRYDKYPRSRSHIPRLWKIRRHKIHGPT